MPLTFLTISQSCFCDMCHEGTIHILDVWFASNSMCMERMNGICASMAVEKKTVSIECNLSYKTQIAVVKALPTLQLD